MYGTTPIGVTSLQYADPNTFVGADPDPTFDADDELVFMSTDAGGKPRPDDPVEPVGVVPGSGVQVLVEDPIDEGKRGWLYLFRSGGTLEPSAGADYVDYDFNLTSGNYKTTYKRADGPNPETSIVTTPNYRIGFTDRWIENQWRIDAGDHAIRLREQRVRSGGVAANGDPRVESLPRRLIEPMAEHPRAAENEHART